MSEKPKLTLVYQEPPSTSDSPGAVLGQLVFFLVLVVMGVCVLGVSSIL